MRSVPVLSAYEAAALIHDGDTVSISSSSALGCPDDVLAGIAQRFHRGEGPTRLTVVMPIAAGDMYGVPGIDRIARPEIISRVVAGSLPSGPSTAEPPAIWQLIADDAIEAYNFPSGVLFQMHRAGSTGQPGVFTHVGLETFVDPRLQGGRMNDRTKEDMVEVRELEGQEWLYFPAIAPDVTIIRATTADENGNLTFEDEGSPLGALDLAYAAHNHGGLVIAQVKRVAQLGALSPQAVRVPGILVDAIVLAPDQWQTTKTPYDPALSGQLRRPPEVIEPVEWSIEKVIARRAAAELVDGDIVNLGFGISALVPRILVEQGRSDAVTWVIEQGAVGGIPLTGFAFGCALNAEALLPSIDQFSLLQGGGFDHALLSFLEVDERGSVNVHYLPSRRHVTAGVGGFADITSRARSIVFSGAFTAGGRDVAVEDVRVVIKREGRLPKFVKRVSGVTFSGRRAIAQGQRVIYITERCVLELRAAGLTVVEIAPGVDLDRDVLALAEFPLLVADDLVEMDSDLFRPEQSVSVPVGSGK